MRRLEAFSGVRVLTYALMSNHFLNSSKGVYCRQQYPELFRVLGRRRVGESHQRRSVVIERDLSRKPTAPLRSVPQ